MWQRNLLFLALVGGGTLALGANLMPPREPKPVTRYDAGAYQAADFRDAVGRRRCLLPAALGRGRRCQPAAAAPDLAVARRLALGLMGTIPSLEEIRQFEWLPAEERLALVGRPHLAGPPLRRLLRRAPGPGLRRHRGRAVHLLPPPPLRRLAGRPGRHEPALRPARPRPDRLRRPVDRQAGHQLRQRHRQAGQARTSPTRSASPAASPGPSSACASTAPSATTTPSPPGSRPTSRASPPSSARRTSASPASTTAPASSRSRTSKTQAKQAVAPRVPFAPELLPDDGQPPPAPGRLGHGPAQPLLRPRHRQPRLGAAARPAAGRAGRQPRVRRPRARRPCRSSPTTSPPTASTCAGSIRVIACTEAFRLDSAADRDVDRGRREGLGRLPADAAAARAGGRRRRPGVVRARPSTRDRTSSSGSSAWPTRTTSSSATATAARTSSTAAAAPSRSAC